LTRMKIRDTDLLKELISQLGVCKCSALGKLAFEGLMLGLGYNPHRSNHSRAAPLIIKCLLVILSGYFIRGLRSLLLQVPRRNKHQRRSTSNMKTCTFERSSNNDQKNMTRMIKSEYYPKEKCNKDISCQFEPCFLAVKALRTPSEFFLCEQILEALKRLATHCLDSMECVHHVGLHMGVLN
jgi:hypothetical protein